MPDIAGEIIAFRAWRVEGPMRHLRLRSLTDGDWPTNDWMRATCALCKSVPGEDCTCGIYAARSHAHLVDMKYHRDASDPVELYDLRVLGEVGLAGKVIRGTQGWRAEKARVLRLWVPYWYWRAGVELRDAYNVPVGLASSTFTGEAVA